MECSDMEIEKSDERIHLESGIKPVYFNYQITDNSLSQFVPCLYQLGDSSFSLNLKNLNMNFIKKSKQVEFEQLVLSISSCIQEELFNPENIKFSSKSQKIDTDWINYVKEIRLKHKLIQQSPQHVLNYIKSDLNRNNKLLQLLGASGYLVDDYIRDKRQFRQVQQNLEKKYRPTRQDIKQIEFTKKQLSFLEKQNK